MRIEKVTFRKIVENDKSPALINYLPQRNQLLSHINHYFQGFLVRRSGFSGYNNPNFHVSIVRDDTFNVGTVNLTLDLYKGVEKISSDYPLTIPKVTKIMDLHNFVLKFDGYENE